MINLIGHIIEDSILNHTHKTSTGVISVNQTSTIITIFKKKDSVQILDLVKISETSGNTVEKCINNKDSNPVIGIVLDIFEEYDVSYCKVLQYGKLKTHSLSVSNLGKKIFIGTNGLITDTPPINGYIQCLGFIYDINKIFFNIFVGMRIKRNPF